ESGPIHRLARTPALFFVLAKHFFYVFSYRALLKFNNNGFWYNLGNVIGLIVLGAGGGGSARASRTKERPRIQGQEAPPPWLLLFASIATAFAWLLFLGLWLFFYVSNFSIWENVGVFVISVAVIAILETAIWVPWGLKQPSK
ncbi:MAG: hypothetical protein WBW25_02110, partial [Halobacteriota archaeon]